jgi:hypothetical protein
VRVGEGGGAGSNVAIVPQKALRHSQIFTNQNKSGSGALASQQLVQRLLFVVRRGDGLTKPKHH